MKVGIIAPISFLDKYCITDIQYCLPRLLVESEVYRNFYIKRKTMGDYIILDCRKLGWKREPEDLKVIKEASTYLHPDITVLPSRMYDWRGTVEVVREFFKEFSKGFQYATCPEGTTEDEISKCLTEIGKDKISTDTVAVPSHLQNVWKGTKETNTLFIENHLNLEKLDGLEGILVTSLPVRLGLEGRLLSNYLPSPISLTFYEEEDNYPTIIKKNVEEIIEYYKT